MDFEVFLLMIVCIGTGLIFWMFPGARKLLHGFIGMFIRDVATTPEGARALFEDKIEEAMDSYNKADDYYKMMSGKLKMANTELSENKRKLAIVESQCEDLVKANKLELAELKSEQREEILSDIGRCNERIKALTDATDQAKEARDICERNLRDLKKKSKEVVENMKVKQELKQVYDGMDELKNITATDKLLDSVMEKNRSLDEIVEGSKAAHNAKLSTRINRAELEAKKVQSNDYLDSLKKKYNK